MVEESDGNDNFTIYSSLFICIELAFFLFDR